MQGIETAYRVKEILFVRFNGTNMQDIARLCQRATRNSPTDVYTVRESGDSVLIEKVSTVGDKSVLTMPVMSDSYIVLDFDRLEVVERIRFSRNFLVRNPFGSRRRKSRPKEAVCCSRP